MQKRGHRPRLFAILLPEIKFKNKKIHYVVRKKEKTGSRYKYKLKTLILYLKLVRNKRVKAYSF